MRVTCQHGYYKFYPDDNGSLARFSKLFYIDFVAVKDYYVFKGLETLKNYSIAGSIYYNLPALKTFEGEPWEVMKENSFVFDLTTGLLLPSLSIIATDRLKSFNQYFTADSRILQAGTRDQSLSQILSYDSDFDFDIMRQRIRWIQYE